MNSQWQNSILRISIWVIVELLLNLLNLDTLGDYSEFVFEQKRYLTAPVMARFNNFKGFLALTKSSTLSIFSAQLWFSTQLWTNC